MKRLSESVWTDIHRRSNGKQVRKEDDLSSEFIKMIDNSLKMFVYSIIYYEPKVNDKFTFNDFKKYFENYNYVGASIVYSSKTDKDTTLPKIESYITRNWNKGKNYEKSINIIFNDELKKIKDSGFVKEPGKSICQTLDNWWEKCNYKKELLFDEWGFDEESSSKWDELFDYVDWDEKIKAYVEDQI